MMSVQEKKSHRSLQVMLMASKKFIRTQRSNMVILVHMRASRLLCTGCR